jgi:hypothetical protein
MEKERGEMAAEIVELETKLGYLAQTAENMH